MKNNSHWVKTSRLLKCVAKMPPLRHKVPGKDFNISESEVVQWLISQPEVQQYIFDVVKGRDQRREQLIKYSLATGLWTGTQREQEFYHD